MDSQQHDDDTRRPRTTGSTLSCHHRLDYLDFTIGFIVAAALPPNARHGDIYSAPSSVFRSALLLQSSAKHPEFDPLGVDLESIYSNYVEASIPSM
jgi:hypothetical protein